MMKHLARVAAAAAVVSLMTLTMAAPSRGLGPRVADAASRTQPSAPEPFKTVLVYDQQSGQFPPLTVPANQRIIVREINAGVLVPPGTAPVGSIWVPPLDPGNTGFLGAYQAALPFAQVSSFQGVQDRFAASHGAFLILEPGQQLTWHLSNRDGENAYLPANEIAASLSISGEVIVLN